jgi:hypothetical protein
VRQLNQRLSHFRQNRHCVVTVTKIEAGKRWRAALQASATECPPVAEANVRATNQPVSRTKKQRGPEKAEKAKAVPIIADTSEADPATFAVITRPPLRLRCEQLSIALF